MMRCWKPVPWASLSLLALTLSLLLPAGLSAMSPRFVNNGDGTISDTQTGLMWEVKDRSSGVHDMNNLYTWTAMAGGTVPDGTLFIQFLAGLNANPHLTDTDSLTAVSFAGGYTDWRIPTTTELRTLRDENHGECSGGSGPCIDPIFDTNCTSGCTSVATNPANACSCMTDLAFWSSTSSVNIPTDAFAVVYMTTTAGTTNEKTIAQRARAVRNFR